METETGKLEKSEIADEKNKLKGKDPSMGVNNSYIDIVVFGAKRNSS